jgi:membrane protease YdiL (CAAX protease family)
MNKTLLQAAAALAVLAAALAAGNRLSTRWVVERESRRSGSLAAHALRGTTPFAWEMDCPEELDLSPSSGIRVLSATGGVLVLETTDGDPYLFLDLGRTVLPAGEFPLFRARWEFSAPAELQFHFWEPGTAVARASGFFPVPAGDLDFCLDFGRLPFHEAIPDREEPVPWGGRSGNLRLFRIDFGNRAGLRVKVDRIALERAPGPGAPAALEAFRELPGSDWPRVPFGPDGPPDGIPLPPWFVGSFEGSAPPASDAVEAADPRRKDALAFETRAFWLTPEEAVLWKRSWDDSVAVPVFLRTAASADIPASPEPVPGSTKRGDASEAARWGLLAGALLGFALLVLLRASRGPAGGRALDLAEAIGAWAAVQADLALFPNPGTDPRSSAVLGSFLAFAIATGVLRSGPAPGREEPPDAGGLWARARRSLGLETPFSLGGWPAAGAFTLSGLAAILLLGWVAGSLEAKSGAAGRLPDYLAKALAQQFLLCPFLAVRFRDALGGRKVPAAACAAALFSLLHLPNFTLAASTLVLGFAWAILYLRRENLLPLIVSHAVLGTASMTLWSAPLLVSHRVGAMFFL